MVKVGDRLVVSSMPYPAYVERIELNPENGVTTLFLDWKEFGKSKVYLHDENQVWYKYNSSN
jgi:hypothetical protein